MSDSFRNLLRYWITYVVNTFGESNFKGVSLKGNASYCICYRSCEGNTHKFDMYRICFPSPPIRRQVYITANDIHSLVDECMYQLRFIITDDSIITKVGVMVLNRGTKLMETYGTKTDLPVKWKVDADTDDSLALAMPIKSHKPLH